MAAKEMFEELGYKLVGNCGGLTYSKKDSLIGRFIVRFENRYQFVYTYWVSNNPVDISILPFQNIINIKLHQAITQQMKEMGWLDESKKK